MNAIRNIAMLVLICLSIIACSDKSYEFTPLRTDAKILAFGDSLTEGYGAQSPDSYPNMLSTMINRTVINGGVSGEVTAEGLSRLPKWLDEHRPDILILCHGGNDLLRKRDPEKMRENIIAMIKMAQARQIDVLLIGVPKPSLLLSELPVFSEIAEQMKIPVLEDAIADILSDSDFKKDAIHPNAAGNRQLASSLHAALKKLGAI